MMSEARIASAKLARRMFAAALLAAVGLAPAAALEEKKDEKAKLKICERRMCQMIVRKAPASGHVQCDIAKTWARKSIKGSSEAKNISWGFGDARCTVDLKVPRSIIVAALKQPEIKVELPLHKVNCEIERDKDISKVSFTLGPKVLFKGGRARKVWINLKDVDGPGVIKSLAMTVAKLEDTVGLFQKDMVKGINSFITEKCPEVVAGK